MRRADRSRYRRWLPPGRCPGYHRIR